MAAIGGDDGSVRVIGFEAIRVAITRFGAVSLDSSCFEM